MNWSAEEFWSWWEAPTREPTREPPRVTPDARPQAARIYRKFSMLRATINQRRYTRRQQRSTHGY